MDSHKPAGATSFCDDPEEPSTCATCVAVCRHACCCCCPGPSPFARDAADILADLKPPPPPPRPRRSFGSSPIGRRNSDIASLGSVRRSDTDAIATYGSSCCDGSPVPAIGFDEGPRTP